MMRTQATRAKPEQVAVHINRQRTLGQNAIQGSDKPRKWDLIVTFAMVAMIGFGSLKGWW